MIEKIKELEKIAGQLNPGPEQRTEWNRQVLAYAGQFIDGLGSAKTYEHIDTSAEGTDTFLISEEAAPLEAVLKNTKQYIDEPGLNPASAGHMGYIPGGGLYPSALGDYIAAVSNRYAGVFFTAPGAVRLENTLTRWMCELIGYPAEAIGNLTSGGSIANLVAIVTAREAHQIKAADIEKAVIYLSEQAHHSIQKAIRIAGLSEAQLRYIPIDKNLRLSVDALKAKIIADKQAGLKPFFISASLGTTNTGAIDPIAPIARLAEQHQLWFHVDAAYGGFFKLVPSMRSKFTAIEKADSVTLDPHKTLFLPFGTGAILVKDKAVLLKAYHYLADYMQDTIGANEEISPADISPELTKHFRGMRLWLPLKLFGLKPFRAALEEKLWLARYFYRQIQQKDRFETGPEPELSIVMFRYIPQQGDANIFNQKLIQTIQKDGRIFLSSTTIDGIFWIRVAIVIFRTHLEQIDLLLAIIDEKTPQITQGLADK